MLIRLNFCLIRLENLFLKCRLEAIILNYKKTKNLNNIESFLLIQIFYYFSHDFIVRFFLGKI